MKYRNSLMTASALILIAGCSGNGSQSTATTSGSSYIMSGVAATGAPISAGKVEVKGANGVVVEDITNSDGSYSANVTTLTEPYLVRVIAPSGEKYISVASKSALAEGKKINVTPLTHTIVANVFGNANADEVFSDFENASSDFSEQKLEDEKDELLQKFVAAGLVGNGKIAGADIDLLNGNLAAGTSEGVDGLLDVIQVNTDASAGIEIKLKGAATALITDKVEVNAVDPVVVAISPTELAAAEAQLDVISLLRTRMNALAALHSSKVACNGAPKDDGGACDIDTLYNTFLPYFHADFQEEGLNRDKGVWGWFCRVGTNHDEATTRAQCLASGSSVAFENVSLKDITLISYDKTTNVALINFNFYLEGVLKGSEDMFLKLDSGDSLYKLLGSKKTFKYWIDTESLFSTTFDKSNNNLSYQGVNTYDVNLNFYYENSGNHIFNGSETFTLTATSGHQIFPGNSSSMNLYLVVGPNYNTGTCASGLVFSTTLKPYKIFNHQTGVSTYENYATACAYTNNPCNCKPDANSSAYYEHDVAQKVTMSLAQILLMDKVENISLTGPGVTGDSFNIKKPLAINEFNAAEHIPSFGMSAAEFCRNVTYTTPLNLSVQSGTLNYVNLHHGFSDANNTWKSESDSEDFWNFNLTSTTYTPSFSGVLSTDVIKNSHLYLSAHDDFERQFVRRVNCNGN